MEDYLGFLLGLALVKTILIVGVYVPQNKIKKFHKWLEKHNCEVIR